MNCKPGDLAIVARATAPDILPYMGRILKCISLKYGPNDLEVWITEPELEPGRGVYDGALLPIRPNDGEDEMIRIAGKPKTKRAIYDTYVRTNSPA